MCHACSSRHRSMSLRHLLGGHFSPPSKLKHPCTDSSGLITRMTSCFSQSPTVTLLSTRSHKRQTSPCCCKPPRVPIQPTAQYRPTTGTTDHSSQPDLSTTGPLQYFWVRPAAEASLTSLPQSPPGGMGCSGKDEPWSSLQWDLLYKNLEEEETIRL